MSDKKWTRKGREFKAKHPSMFSAGSGHSQRSGGGAHRRATDYRRNDTRNEERNAKRDWS